MWSPHPYKGFSFYGPGDASLFAGREDNVPNCARLMAALDTRVLILQGGTGCGKSSFLRAGLIPFLETKSHGFKFLADGEGTSTKALFIRSTDKPLFKLAECLYKLLTEDFPLQTPKGLRNLDLWKAFIEMRSSFTKPDNVTVFWGNQPGDQVLQELQKAVDDLSHSKELLKFVETVGGNAVLAMLVVRSIAKIIPQTLILVVDQAEEAITLTQSRGASNDQKPFFEFLSHFSKIDFDLKLLVAIRTEFYGKFAHEIQRHKADMTKITYFMLEDLNREQLIQAIKQPTAKDLSEDVTDGAGQPYDFYKFSYEMGLPEKIADDLLSAPIQGGILPVMQIVCERLFKRTKEKAPADEYWEITENDYRELGRVEGQIGDYISEVIVSRCMEKFPEAKDEEVREECFRWIDLLSELAQAQVDGTVTTDLKRSEELKEIAQDLGCRLDYADMMKYLSDDDQRILRPPAARIDLESRKAFECFSLGHDAIGLVLHNWRLAKLAKKEKKAQWYRTIQLPFRIFWFLASLLMFILAIVVLYAWVMEGKFFSEFAVGLIITLFLGIATYLASGFKLKSFRVFLIRYATSLRRFFTS